MRSPPRQELVRHADRLVEGSAGVFPQIQQQLLHPEIVQLPKPLSQLARAGLREIAEAHVPGGGVDHERPQDRGDRDLVPFDLQIDQLVVAPPPNGHDDGAAPGPPELPHGVVTRDAAGVLALDARDDVPAPNAPAIRGRSLEEVHHRDVAVDDVDGDAQPVVAPLLPLAEPRVRAGIHEVRVRIERLQHAAGRPVDELLGVDLADIRGLDRSEGGRKRLVTAR